VFFNLSFGFEVFMSKIASYTILAMILMGLLYSCGGGGQDSPKAWVVSTLAGSTRGFKNGAGDAAQFKEPYGVAVDTSGNIYVADEKNNQIRKITRARMVSTFAGSETHGLAEGIGTEARFSWPTGVAVDTLGNIYVADKDNDRIRKITPEREVSDFAGSGSRMNPGFADGDGDKAKFRYPYGVAVDTSGNITSGNIYVTDRNNHRIRKLTTDSNGVVNVDTFAGSGTAGSLDGTGTAAQFNYPNGIAVDTSGNIYVADSFNQVIRKITPEREVSTIAGRAGDEGSANGDVTKARFRYPTGVAVDSSGNIYVADRDNHRIRKITTDSSGVVSVSTFAGSTSGFRNGFLTEAQFNEPTGVAVDTLGNIYVADKGNHQIRKIEYKVP